MNTNIKFQLAGQLFGCPDFDHVVSMVKHYYDEPHRFYHNASHIEHGLAEFMDYYNGNIPRYVLIAWLFHDAVYTHKEAELNSVLLMKSLMKLHFAEMYEKYHDDFELAEYFILATINHQIPDVDNDVFPDFSDEEIENLKIFLDVDMLYLGSDEDFFRKSRENVRKEYIIYNDSMFVEGTLDFYNKLLSQDKIFLSERYSENESIARLNIINDIKRLTQG